MESAENWGKFGEGQAGDILKAPSMFSEVLRERKIIRKNLKIFYMYFEMNIPFFATQRLQYFFYIGLTILFIVMPH